MKWIEIKGMDDLPPEGKYVVAKHNRGTWHDSDDQENVNTVIVKLVKGLSEEDRDLMRRGVKENPSEGYCSVFQASTPIKRSDIYKSCDVHGNNTVPYNWEPFGIDSFFGQSITHWAAIEPLP